MKIVLWRWAHNCLPTGQHLKKRNIPAYDLCFHCGREETTEHTCQYVAEIWRELKKRCGLKRLLKPFVSPRQWIFYVLAGCTDREATIFVISLWHIWEARNAIRNGEREVHPHRLVEKILAYVDMVVLHMYDPVIPNSCDSVKPKYWSPPPEGWVMVNVDATIFQKANRMGLGIVVRDHRGEVLAARRQGIDMITNPEFAEAIAIIQAIVFTSELPYNRVVIATDCLSLVQKLRSEAMDRLHTGILTQDIKKVVQASTVLYSFIHVSRSCNEVAHVLARSALY
jgi:ribonuclease HI